MANSIPDLVVTTDDWIDVATLTSIPAGTEMVIQNKGTTAVLVWIGQFKPSADSTDGPVIYDYPHDETSILIDEDEDKVWLKSTGSVDGLVNVRDDS